MAQATGQETPRWRLGLGKTADQRAPVRRYVYRVAALLKRWILGTHQGYVIDKHLDYYLDEFTFRLNRRHSRTRGLLFYRLLQQAVQVKPVPYRQLVGQKRRTWELRDRSGYPL